MLLPVSYCPFQNEIDHGKGAPNENKSDGAKDESDNPPGKLILHQIEKFNGKPQGKSEELHNHEWEVVLFENGAEDFEVGEIAIERVDIGVFDVAD